MFSDELEMLIEAAIADGVITEKERAVLIKRAEAEGVDIEEFNLVLESKLDQYKKNLTKSHNRESLQPRAYQWLLSNLERNIRNVESESERLITSLRKETFLDFKNNKLEDYYEYDFNKNNKIFEIGRERDKKIKAIIDNVPFSDNVRDIHEMLQYLKPKTISSYKCPYGKDVKDAFIAKYNEFLKIAREKYEDQPDIKAILDREAEEEKKEKENQRKNEEALSRQTLIKLKKEIDDAKNASYPGNYDSRIKKRSKAVAAVIKNFQLPDNREDLLELMKYLRPFYNKDVWKDRENEYKREAEAYREKYIESSKVAQELFPGDAEIEKECIKKKKLFGLF